MVTEKLNLRKDFVLNLKKTIGLDGQKSQVVLALDHSGSMSSLYSNGHIQEVVERILPLGMAFDDNNEVDFYLFHDGVQKVSENLTPQNIHGFIKNKINCGWGGTRYSPIINAIIQQFGSYTTTGGFLGIGSKKIPIKLNLPVYVIFITDGENSDREEAEAAIKEASKHGIFFQFVGIGNESFSFLRMLDTMSGRNIDNANFFRVPDLSRKSDEELYSLLLAEYPSFITEARLKGMIS